MSEPFVFDPRHILCKDPFGAVSCGTEVTFHCRPLPSDGFTRCSLVLHREFADRTEHYPLTLAGEEYERTHFTVTIPAPKEPDLVWYHFRFWQADGTCYALDKSGYRSDGSIIPWQLTVYAENHTPEWFGDGATYQIFPDRYCRLTEPKPEGLIGERWIQEDWSAVPHWKPDATGEIRNNNFFGGQLAGVTSKLDELEEMGISTIYFCPIFESASNHRYNTADYSKIDPMLGTEEDFRHLCAEAKKRGIRVILDGVFNHIGSQSLYFNADGYYPTLGAAQSKDSPYYDWFDFKHWPDKYESWWGFKTLPNVREECPSYVDYIIENEDAIIRRWLRAGASGWRLDVADELPDEFIEKIRTAVEETDPEAILIGEVWEDASIKIAYSKRRRYFLGTELHGVMNYPFRTATMNYLKGGRAEEFREAMETIRENYPPAAFHSAMNFLGTHDTARILTALGTDHSPRTKDDRAAYRLTPAERARGAARVKLAALMLFTFPGSPMVYYGDEAGMEGFEDPFNRAAYPWGREDKELKDWYTRLGQLRKQHDCLRRGEIVYLHTDDAILVYGRVLGDKHLVTAVNAEGRAHTITLSWQGETATDLMTGTVYPVKDGALKLHLPARTGMLLT